VEAVLMQVGRLTQTVDDVDLEDVPRPDPQSRTDEGSPVGLAAHGHAGDLERTFLDGERRPQAAVPRTQLDRLVEGTALLSVKGRGDRCGFGITLSIAVESNDRDDGKAGEDEQEDEVVRTRCALRSEHDAPPARGLGLAPARS